MPKAYWITTYRSVSDPQALAAYARLAGPALESQGARFLARGIPERAMEQGLKERTVVIEFPDMEAALAAYDSAGYQEALAALGKHAAERDMRVVAGIE